MKKEPLHTVHLSPEADEIVERRKAQTGASKEIIVNRIVLAAGRRWYPKEDKP